MQSPHKAIRGREVKMTLPYSEIGVSSGQVIRIAIREEDSTFDEKSYFPEVLFTLK